MQEQKHSEHLAVIESARSWLTEQINTRKNERPPCAATIESYAKDYTRLKKKGDIWKAALSTTKKSSFFKYRAAILHNCRHNIEQLLSRQEKLQQNGGLSNPITHSAWLEEVNQLRDALDLALQTRLRPQLKKVQKRETKRVDLFRLPENWREELISRMPNYKPQAAITALSGCRPAELVAGIEITLERNLLTVLIRGAKIGIKSGQEWRELNWKLPSANSLAMLVADIISDSYIEIYGDEDSAAFDKFILRITTPNAKAFSGAMREAGKRAFPLFNHTITPYSMRHQFASDMKTAELPGDNISQALGHSSEKTKGSYGAFGHGRAGMSPSCIAAARQVRASPMPSPEILDLTSYAP